MSDNLALVRQELLVPYGVIVVRDGFLYLHESLADLPIVVVMVADKSWTCSASLR